MAQSEAEVEDGVIRRVWAVTLDAQQADASANPPVLLLAGLAQELAEERSGGSSSPLLLSRDILDRVVVARLMEEPPQSYPQPPAQYLIGAFVRASGELRAAGGPRATPEQAAAIQAAAASCKELAVSYLGLVLSGSGVVPEPQDAAERGALQLLDSMDATPGSSGSISTSGGGSAAPKAGVVALPPSLLEEFAAKHAGDTLQTVLAPIACALARRVAACSPLGDYAPPLAALRHLAAIEPAAHALVTIPQFLPDLAAHTGRAAHMAGSCWLGAAFSVSAIPDRLLPQQPSIAEQCFGSLQSRRQGDLLRSMASLRMAGKHIAGELHAIVKALLGKATRERMLTWLGSVIENNTERAKMQADLSKAASHGLFINLGAVMLRLCGPFMDPSSRLFWKRVDASYLWRGGRLSVKEDSKLSASAEEEAAWQERQRAASGADASSSGGGAPGPGEEGGYHFVCEAFFMTYKALHLGVVKLIEDMSNEARNLQWLSGQVRQMEAAAAAGNPHPQLRDALARAKAELDRLQVHQMAVETVLGDPDAVSEILAFYRLAAAWLLRTAAPNSTPMMMGAGGPPLPLSAEVPGSWATLPEWMVADLADYLLYVTRFHPQLLSSLRLDDMMLFLVTCIGSPGYIRSPFLRSKLSEVIHAWLPASQEQATFRRGGRSAGDAAGLSYLFEAHPSVVQHLVPSLLSLYSDIEYTDRGSQFYTKFSLRQFIGEILAYCWTLPQHRAVWSAYAALEGGRGPYQKFANMLISDSIYLLNEALSKLKELREFETLQGDSGRWAALPREEQEERSEAAQMAGEHLKILLTHAGVSIRTLAYSTQSVVAPFLLPEMVGRLAGMLNYFLLHLTGPSRKDLKVRDPDKYNFKPKELLSQICTIYLHAAAADHEGAFAAAVAGDARSYRPEMFAEASLVLRQFGLLPEADIGALEALAGRVATAASAEAEEEEALGEAPDDFLDPITCTLMIDPVTLPSSGAIMDRATIMRHLLGDQRDPINRAPLTPDMLVPAEELKARIVAWRAQQRAAKLMQID